jgi:hypothetical protein
MSPRQLLSLDLKFCPQLESEERFVFPMLAWKMPVFRDSVRMLV